MYGRPGATLAAALATFTASTALVPLFRSPGYLISVIFAIASVALAGFLSRQVRLPAALHPLLGLLALVTVLTWMFALPSAAWGVLPGPAAIEELRSLIQVGIAESQIVVAPVAASPALVLLAAGGVGVIALVVDTIGVTLRLPAVAGIPLLVLFSVPAAIVRDGVPWWLLPLTVLGWLVLLAVDSQAMLRTWGAPLAPRRQRPRSGAGPQAHPRRAPARVSPAGWLAAAAAVVVAVSIPTALPWLDEPVWGTGRGEAIPGGANVADGSVSLDPFVSLQRNLVNNSDQVVLRYTTDAANPGYLRMLTLTEFDGVRWSAPRASVRLPISRSLPPPVTAPGVQTRTESHRIRVGDLINPELPVPYAATQVTGVDEALGAQWSWDPATRTVLGQNTSAQGRAYDVTSVAILPSRNALRNATTGAASSLAPLTTLPPDLDPMVATLAAQVTQGATSPYEQAAALEQWFTRDGGFTYSTAIVGSPDIDPVVEFLTDRVGYCEQYAATMALMARSLGIPARVNIGFTAGTVNTEGTWTVRGRNAHAWPELWFDGLGWVWFEPTPRADDQSGVTSPPYSDVPDREQQVPDPIDAAEPPPVVDVDPGAPSASGSGSGIAAWLIAIGAIAALTSTPFIFRALRRRQRTGAQEAAARIEGAWQELETIAKRWGCTWPASTTPRDAGALLMERGELSAEGSSAVRSLVGWVELSRYAPGKVTAVSAVELREKISAVEHDLKRGASAVERLRALR